MWRHIFKISHWFFISKSKIVELDIFIYIRQNSVNFEILKCFRRWFKTNSFVIMIFNNIYCPSSNMSSNIDKIFSLSLAFFAIIQNNFSYFWLIIFCITDQAFSVWHKYVQNHVVNRYGLLNLSATFHLYCCDLFVKRFRAPIDCNTILLHKNHKFLVYLYCSIFK